LPIFRLEVLKVAINYLSRPFYTGQIVATGIDIGPGGDSVDQLISLSIDPVSRSHGRKQIADSK
jgi:hypothetical protein